MATTKISSAGVTFPDATVQDSASPGIVVTRLYTSPSPWTKPGALKSVKVTALGGGGGGGNGLGPVTGLPPSTYNGGNGGIGGQGYFYAQAAGIPGPVTVTVGAGGGVATAGGASSFGPIFSIAGGGGGSNSTPTTAGTPGTPGFTLSVTSTPNTVTVKALNGLVYGTQGSTPPGIGSGTSATGFGYGGGGGRGTAGSGGSGAGGFVIVEEFY